MSFYFRQTSIFIAVFVAIFATIFSSAPAPANAAQLKQSDSDASAMLEAISEDLDITNVSRISELIVASADVDVKNKFGATPLHMAAQSGFTEVVELLIKARADLNKPTDRFGVTPLYLAAQNGHAKVVTQLIKARADVNLANMRDNVTPLWIASQENHPDIVRLLLEAHADVNKTRASDKGAPLYIAADKGNLRVVRLLLKGAAIKDEPEELKKANKDIDASEIELTTGVDVTLDGVLSLLLDGQAELEREIEETKKLLKSNINVDAKGTNGHTALMLASRKGHGEIAGELLRYGADVNASSDKGRTPLMYAAHNGSLDLVKEFLSRGADPKAITGKGESALSFAKEREHERIVELLTETLKAEAGTSSR